MNSRAICILALVAVLSCGCQRQRAGAPIVVHVFRDRSGPCAESADAVLRRLGTRQWATPKGRPITIATYEPKNYEEGLQNLGDQLHPEILILNSDKDRLSAHVNLSLEQPLNKGQTPCLAGIPSWVPTQEGEAAAVVLSAMREELQRQ